MSPIRQDFLRIWAMEKKEKRIIGITGGVGTGKSTVMELLKEDYGAEIILADLVAHELMEPGTEGLRRVSEALGAGFLKEDGSVDRQALAELLFHNQAARETMNGILHPMVWEEIRKRAADSSRPLVIVEAAVFDTAPAGFFDEIWYVFTDKEVRIRRLMESRGYTREKCESIMAGQDTEEQYKSRCSRILYNNGGKDEIRKQLEEIFIS